MKAHIVNIDLLLAVETDTDAADAVNEILREHLRKFAPMSCLLDYRFQPAAFDNNVHPVEVPADFASDDVWPDERLTA